MTERLRKAVIKTLWVILIGVLLYGFASLIWKDTFMVAYIAGSVAVVGFLVIDTWVRF